MEAAARKGSSAVALGMAVWLVAAGCGTSSGQFVLTGDKEGLAKGLVATAIDGEDTNGEPSLVWQLAIDYQALGEQDPASAAFERASDMASVAQVAWDLVQPTCAAGDPPCDPAAQRYTLSMPPSRLGVEGVTSLDFEKFGAITIVDKPADSRVEVTIAIWRRALRIISDPVISPKRERYLLPLAEHLIAAFHGYDLYPLERGSFHAERVVIEDGWSGAGPIHVDCMKRLVNELAPAHGVEKVSIEGDSEGLTIHAVLWPGVEAFAIQELEVIIATHDGDSDVSTPADWLLMFNGYPNGLDKALQARYGECATALGAADPTT